MIENNTIEQRLLETNQVKHVQVTGDGYHYQLLVVSDVFCNKAPVARQQWVYTQLHDYITTGSLHALTMQTYTVAEWEKKHG